MPFQNQPSHGDHGHHYGRLSYVGTSPSSHPYEGIARPDLLLDYQAELGAARGFCAWYDHLTGERDSLTKYLGSASIDACAEWREQWLQSEPARLRNSEPDLHRQTLCRNLLGALHSVSVTARYLGESPESVVDCAFQHVSYEAVQVIEDLLAQGETSRTRLAEAAGVTRKTALNVVRALGESARELDDVHAI